MTKNIVEVGRGSEHVVTGNSDCPQWVMKRPGARTILTLLGKSPVKTINNEIDQAQQIVKGTSVIFPETRVSPIGKRSYRMLQERVEDDGQIDIGQFLTEKGNPTLLVKFGESPSNFVSSGEK